ncbi:MAG: hypothetical protein NTX64_01730 [Elusimicrobia bacterium]|nr:hypothetical protein [Elusimicrobiota bacterium]
MARDQQLLSRRHEHVRLGGVQRQALRRGATDAQTLAGTLNLVNSTNTIACYGYLPCGANNQVIFTAVDRAGNVFRAGPFAVQVDATTSMAISTPSYPASGAFVTAQPNFNWTGPSTAVVAGLPPGSSYYLQVSNNDPAFSAGNIVVSISTPAVVTSTMMATGFGAYISTYTLANAATFYWRVQTVNGEYGSTSAWSQTYSFETDLVAPAAAGAFTSISSTGGVMGETQISNLMAGVVAQVPVQDLQSGLVLSTYVVAFAGDGHDNPGVASAYGVTYSTNAGQTWIDASTVTAMNGGNVVVAGAANLRGMTVYNGRLYLADGTSGKVYSSADGNTWSAAKGGSPVGTNGIRPLITYLGRLYAADGTGKIWWSADNGTSWTQSNNNTAVSTTVFLSMAVFNGRLYAGDLGGRVFVSTDGNQWNATLTGGGALVGGFPGQQIGGAIWSLGAFNGRVFAGDNLGRVFASVDGSTWSYTNGAGGVAGAPLFAGASISGLAAFNNKLVAIDSATGRVFVSTDGINWNGGVQAAGGNALQSLTAFNGKLYAGDGTGRIFVSTEGSAWLTTNGGYAIGVSTFWALAPFNGKLYAADNNGYAYQVTPLAATLGGSDGTTAVQGMGVSGMNLANSSNTTTCGGVWPCGATDQVMFTAADVAGNVGRIGPFAIQVDGTTALAISAPVYPANGAYVSTGTVNFNWTGPSTMTVAGLPGGTSYFLQVSRGDPAFAQGNIVVSISTPMIQVSTMLPTAFGAYNSTYTLANNATFYWRLATINGASQSMGLFSTMFTFVTDLTPTVQSGLFSTLSPAGGTLNELQINNLATGVTAQIGVADLASGLAVSTGALPFAGDGHDNPGLTGGFGVIYSTNAGQTWIYFSGAITPMNGGNPIISGATNLRSMAVFNNKLYAVDGLNGKIYSSADGNSWSASAIVGGGGTGGPLRALAVFNNRLYTADFNSTGKAYWTENGTNWTVSNGNFALGPTSFISALAAFNGRLYAGDASVGRIYVSTSGDSWSMIQSGAAAFQSAGGIQSFTSFNGRLYEGDASGRVYYSLDGSTWVATNNGNALVAGANIVALAAFNNRLFAVDASSRIFQSMDGWSWIQSSNIVSGPGGAPTLSVNGNFGSSLSSLAQLNGKLYAADATYGKIYVSTEGSTWMAINSSYPVTTGVSPVFALAPFNGRLYGGDQNGRVYQGTGRRSRRR